MVGNIYMSSFYRSRSLIMFILIIFLGFVFCETSSRSSTEYKLGNETKIEGPDSIYYDRSPWNMTGHGKWSELIIPLVIITAVVVGYFIISSSIDKQPDLEIKDIDLEVKNIDEMDDSLNIFNSPYDSLAIDSITQSEIGIMHNDNEQSMFNIILTPKKPSEIVQGDVVVKVDAIQWPRLLLSFTSIVGVDSNITGAFNETSIFVEDNTRFYVMMHEAGLYRVNVMVKYVDEFELRFEKM